MTYKVL